MGIKNGIPYWRLICFTLTINGLSEANSTSPAIVLDRHLQDKADQVALFWEPNEPEHETRSFTYQELYTEVCRFANALKALGVAKGDRICFYMPMIPQLVIGILACARLGAIHSVVFADFLRFIGRSD
jgi:acyl-coenzyme A synthetase/AMP-(fatty) acid ligase